MDRGIESGSGMISSLQGVGSGSSRSLSPRKTAPSTQLMLYCVEPVKSVISLGSETNTRTRPFAKTLNWPLASRFCCSKIPTKNESTLRRDNPILRLTPQIFDSVLRGFGNMMDRFGSVIQLVNRKVVFSSETNLFQISLQGKIQHREQGLDGGQSRIMLETGSTNSLTISALPPPAITWTVS